MVEAGFELLREFTWTEVWQIDTREPAAVLDVLKYTGFHTADTMDRFDEFVAIAQPLMARHAGYVTQSCCGGVAVSFGAAVSPAEWRKIGDTVWRFNQKHFTCELPRAGHLKAWKRSSGVWFGHC